MEVMHRTSRAFGVFGIYFVSLKTKERKQWQNPIGKAFWNTFLGKNPENLQIVWHAPKPFFLLSEISIRIYYISVDPDMPTRSKQSNVDQIKQAPEWEKTKSIHFQDRLSSFFFFGWAIKPLIENAWDEYNNKSLHKHIPSPP